MQKIVFLLLFVFYGTSSFSQQEFFVYLQADNHQPFYARINTRMYSSTEQGYMIIPKLGDSTYAFTIGFARNAFPEQTFAVAVNRKDKGFQLKNLGEKGWALVNLQSAAVIMNSGLPLKTPSEFAGSKKTDAFSTMLANVVNDSAILYSAVKPKPVEIVPEKKVAVAVSEPEEKLAAKDSSQNSSVAALPPAVKKPVEQSDTVLKETSVTKKDMPKTAEVITKTDANGEQATKNVDTITSINQDLTKKTTAEKPFISKIEEKKTNGTYEATYLEQYVLNTDTIKISFPLLEGKTATPEPVTPVFQKQAEPVPEPKKDDSPKTIAQKPAVIDTMASAKRVIQITNSDCKALATDYDVDKLRVKLISDNAIDDKLATAKKYFKTKCLSVKQITALTELFPSDETRYRFFDTAYPYVSDSSNFYRLEELIESDYYKKRFKAMIGK